MNKRHFLSLAVTALGGLALGPGRPAASGNGEILQDGVSFRWRHEGGRLRCEMAAPTSGWIAAGFNEKPQLQNTWFVIAAVSVSPIVVEEHIALVPDHKAVERLGLNPVIADATGAMDNGKSTLVFSLPQVFPQRPALALAPGRQVQLMLAWSAQTDFQHHSAWRRHFDITL